MPHRQPNMQQKCEKYAIFVENPLFYSAIAAQLDAESLQITRHNASQQLSELPEDCALILIPETKSDLSLMLEKNAALNLPMLALLPTGVAPDDASALYLQRPLRWQALASQLKRLTHANRKISWRGLGDFDPVRAILTAGDQYETLTEREAALLEFLAQQNAPVTREMLMREVWQHQQELETHTLETTLYRLRGKLSTLFGTALQICHNELGYCLNIRW